MRGALPDAVARRLALGHPADDALGDRPLPEAAEVNRAQLMLTALQTGGWKTRRELFEHAGEFFLTNNAASELRAQGYEIEHDRDGRLDRYRLHRSSSPAGASTPCPLAPAPQVSATDPSEASTDEPGVALSPAVEGSVAEQLPLYREPRRGAYSEEAA